MNIFLKGLFLIVSSLLLISCSTPLSGDCPPNAIIEWVDMLKINDRKYQHDFVEDPSSITIEKGALLGEVSYRMADHACTNHQMKNGDAAYLEEGTEIFEVKGFPSSLMVVADGKVYVVEENPKAKTIGELYPLEGLVKNIHIQSTEDGKRIHTFSPSSMDAFLRAWLPLKLVDPEKMYHKNKFEGEQIFLEIELTNGVSFRILYWSESNTFHLGAIGNDEVAKIITQENQSVKN